MNNKQKLIAVITLLGIGVTFLFPRWARLEYRDAGQGQVLLTVLERRLFNNPPEASEVKAPYVAWRYGHFTKRLMFADGQRADWTTRINPSASRYRKRFRCDAMVAPG